MNILFIAVDRTLCFDARLSPCIKLCIGNINAVLSKVPGTKLVLVPQDSQENTSLHSITAMLGGSKVIQDITQSSLDCIGESIKGWLDSHKSLGVCNFAVVGGKSAARSLGMCFPNNFINCDAVEEGEGFSARTMKRVAWALTNFGADKMDTAHTFVVADTHFFHGNIIKYCKRPWSSGTDSDGNTIVTDADIQRMNDDMVANWNSVVGRDDTVWHLGDFCLGKKDNISLILPKLNGKINLVMGNHDHQPLKFYYDCGFHRVYDKPVIVNGFYILSHAPLQWVQDDGPYANIFGHVHDQALYKTVTKRSLCACVERWNYTPVSWERVQEELEKANS